MPKANSAPEIPEDVESFVLTPETPDYLHYLACLSDSFAEKVQAGWQRRDQAAADAENASAEAAPARKPASTGTTVDLDDGIPF